MLIGLTGKYCAGKNHIASLLQARGLPVLDVDKLGYIALESEKEKIFAEFGSDLRGADGSLNRRLLGKKVFGNPKKLAALEEIVHPVANRLTEEWCQRSVREASEKGQSSVPVVINAALLHRSCVFNRLNRIIIVKAPFLTRLIRAKRRDKLSWLAIFKRFASQKDFDTQYLAKNAEIYIVKNPNFAAAKDGSLARRKPNSSNQHQLECQIDAFLEGIR